MNGNMAFIKRCVFILFFLFISCSGDDDSLYNFPSLSKGQLVDLKTISETIEGFFITTDLSDLDSSWAERGFYLYVCIRFLNDKTVNEKLKKSAVPLLIQVSNNKDTPEAESVLLLHPKTVKSAEGGIFYYEEKQYFQFTDSPITIREMEYNIFDVEFNQKGKITRMFFIKKGTDLENLQELREAAEMMTTTMRIKLKTMIKMRTMRIELKTMRTMRIKLKTMKIKKKKIKKTYSSKCKLLQSSLLTPVPTGLF